MGERLGTGGMADVFRATDRVLHREVAVKVMRETADSETDRLRFTSEARMLAGLSHPNLVMVLDAGTTTDQPYLVMELVEGDTLSQRATAMVPDELAEVGAQVADALAYAHAKGVVHRDVKPANVLLGDDGRVKLADFGIARLLGDTVRHTRTGQAMGTAAYLAPEQVRGDDLTPAADVYALGLVLLEVLTGGRAFPGSPTESALARLHRDPELPTSLSGPWRDLLSRMTARTPAERPSGAEVAAALRGLDEAGATRVLEPGDQTVRRLPAVAPASPSLAARLAAVPTHLRAAGAAGVALVLLLVVAALAGGGGDDDPEEQVPPTRTTPAATTPSSSPQDSAPAEETEQEAEPPAEDSAPADDTGKPDKDEKKGKGQGKGNGKGKG
nr:serine/threonine-protein kinase [Nocardioides lijunqiniae]